MTIGFDFRMGGSGHGGIGRYAAALLREILALAQDDKFIIFTHPDAAAEEIEFIREYQNAKIVEVRARHYSLAEQVIFLRVLEKYNLDIMHFPNFNHPIRYRGKFVTTIHDMVHHELSGHKPTRYLHFLAYKKVMRHAVLASRAIITPSQASKDAILKYSEADGGTIRAEKIRVIYEGASLSGVTDRDVQKLKKQFLLERPYFLFVGTLERKKRVPFLARVFDRFIEEHKLDMDLVIAGKVDPHYPEEREKALSIKNHDRVVLTGFVSDTELSALYQGAFAYISLGEHEGFNLPGVEAMHFGVPVIGVNVPVANEIFDSGAIYAAVGDLQDAVEKMHLLARDRQFYNRQAGLALARSKVFSWKRAAEETTKVYEEAAGS